MGTPQKIVSQDIFPMYECFVHLFPMCECFACMNVCVPVVCLVPSQAEEGVGSSGMVVKLPCWCWELNMYKNPIQDWQVL